MNDNIFDTILKTTILIGIAGSAIMAGDCYLEYHKSSKKLDRLYEESKLTSDPLLKIIDEFRISSAKLNNSIDFGGMIFTPFYSASIILIGYVTKSVSPALGITAAVIGFALPFTGIFGSYENEVEPSSSSHNLDTYHSESPLELISSHSETFIVDHV